MKKILSKKWLKYFVLFLISAVCFHFIYQQMITIYLNHKFNRPKLYQLRIDDDICFFTQSDCKQEYLKDRVAFLCSQNIRIEISVDKSMSKKIEEGVNLTSLNLNDYYYFQTNNKIIITKSKDYVVTIIPLNISSQDIINNLRLCRK
ncbi:MAG: hypothetical protein HQK49_05630 [Oligoflexia bacterium]|nr:hypothetical protein [Oligoflexia bacterium]